ncbi:MAG TPA: ferrochelatase [Rickettsiales bacterium]|nr:ferrochelatase [Rickettsiales bacterium]
MKTAVVLFNLGGPDSLESVKPFLFNLFNDKAIIPLPQPLRYLVAQFIASGRAPAAKEIYEEIDGRSPLLAHTQDQAYALQEELELRGNYKVFVAMRYWHPFVKEVVAEVKEYDPDKVVLLPLYPQFSSTTTGSAFAEWYVQARQQGLLAEHHPICCYPFDNQFIGAHIQLIRQACQEAERFGKPRILFSAHGLPQRVIDKGDPYQWQVEKTVAAIMRKLESIDYALCYQSRVGTQKWLGPSTTDEIERAGLDGVPVVVVPIAFVSEHSETLVELDIEYRRVASKSNVVSYTRVPALGTHPEFIQALAWLVEATKLYPNCSNSLGRQCPKEFGKCGFTEWKS